MPVTLELEPLIVVHELDAGAVYAHPLANANLVSRARSVDEALEAQRRFLSKYLATISAQAIAEYVFPPESELIDVAVTVPRADLPPRIRLTTPLTVPCVVVPDGDDRWVHVPGLGHVIFVPEGEELEARVRAEIVKTATARELEAAEHRALWPARRSHITRCGVTVEREHLADLGERASLRRKRAKRKRAEAAQKVLAEIGDDWTDPERAVGAPVLEREREVRSLGALLGGNERLAVALVGPEMAGKSAVLRGLTTAQKSRLGGRKVIATSGAQLVAGQSGFGQLQERIEQVMRAAEQLDAILYFDNLGDLFAGHSGSIEDMAAIMRPYLADGRVRVVGELSPEQWEHHEKRHVGFFALLHRVVVEPLGADATRSLLESRVAFEREHEPDRPSLLPDALGPLIGLSDRYLSYEAFPGKAVHVYEELRAVGEGEVTPTGEPRPIGPKDVYRGFATRSGIPVFLLRDEQSMKVAQVESFFGRAVIGQRDAIGRLAETLCMVKAGLQPPAKPLANFLFVGPTGVGKTEVAKTLARFLFGGSERLLRFDMSEYMDPLAAERLIRGSESDEGELTRKVRQQPFCVILLDEIEKAHRAVFDLLLQVCGEGRLSDARGKTTFFHNAIIIMTSNLGATHRRTGTGFEGSGDRAADPGAEDRHYLEQVDRHFRPEFVNRLDRIVPFHSLGRDEIAKVAEVTLQRLMQRDGLLHRAARLDVGAEALAALAQAGYSEQYGARALRRHLEDALVTPVAAVAASLGRDIEGALVEVDVVQRPPRDRAPEDGAHVITQEIGGLRLRVFRPPGRLARETSTDLQVVAALRRVAHRCTAAGPVAQMRERLDYLVADMVGGDDRAVPSGASMSAMAAEHARIASTLRGIDEAVASVENAEELAMAALEEGEPAGVLRDEAAEAFGAFERAYVRGVLGTSGRDEITFIARGTEHPRMMRRWLLPFLEAAELRQWSVTIHRYDDDEPGDEPWRQTLKWGSPRRADWTVGRLGKAKDGDLVRRWRAVLVRVRGPLAGSLLCREMGLVRYIKVEESDVPQHAELIQVADAATVTVDDLATDAFALPEKVRPPEARRMSASRVWGEDGSVVVAGKWTFPRRAGFDYWRDIERVAFPGIAEAALRGNDLDDDD